MVFQALGHRAGCVAHRMAGVRKGSLRSCGIQTLTDLQQRQGRILQLLVNEHTTLRIKEDDSNRSRWALHPLWRDLMEQVAKIEVLEGLETLNELDMNALLEDARCASQSAYMVISSAWRPFNVCNTVGTRFPLRKHKHS